MAQEFSQGFFAEISKISPRTVITLIPPTYYNQRTLLLLLFRRFIIRNLLRLHILSVFRLRLFYGDFMPIPIWYK